MRAPGLLVDMPSQWKSALAAPSSGEKPRDMAHLASVPGLALAVEVETGGEDRPIQRLPADQVRHLGVAVARGRASGQPATARIWFSNWLTAHGSMVQCPANPQAAASARFSRCMGRRESGYLIADGKSGAYS